MAKTHFQNAKTHFQNAKTHFKRGKTHFHSILLEWTWVEFQAKKKPEQFG